MIMKQQGIYLASPGSRAGWIIVAGRQVGRDATAADVGFLLLLLMRKRIIVSD